MNEQDTAIRYTAGHARLIAGPGTGKTHSIIEHIKHLISEGADVNKIQALTFSRAAGKEMQERLESALPGQNVPDARTLHSFCFKELRVYTGSEYVGNYVLDHWEETGFLAEDLSACLGVTPARVKTLLGEHDAAWRSLTTPPSGAQQSAMESEVEKLREIYDFARRGELVYKFKKFLEADPNYTPELQDLIVDEYQDLNACDLAVIKEIASRSSCRLYVAGDDDQCIYRFRHADPTGIRNFESEYENAQSFNLELCRRCGKPILDAAVKLMSHEQNRIPKTLTAQKEDGEVKVLSFRGVRAQSQWVLSSIRQLLDEGYACGDILILVPKRSFAQGYVDVLRGQDIEAENYANSEAILDEVEVRKLIYAVRFAKNPENSVALRSWLYLTPRVGKQSIKAVIEQAREHNLSFYGACKDYGTTAIKNAVTALEEMAEKVKDKEKFEDALSAAGINDDVATHLRNIAKELHISEQADESAEELPEAEETETQLSEEAASDTVRVMTFRNAKGLSAKVVIVTDLDDDITPGNAPDIDEERRLLYVSMTRAIEKLYLTHVVYRRGASSYAGAGHRAPGVARQRSRFLNEIGINSSSSE